MIRRPVSPRIYSRLPFAISLLVPPTLVSPLNFAGPAAFPVAPTTAPLTTLGPWELVRLIGEGSWCRVYQARPVESPIGTPADYAVKVLRPEFAQHAHAIVCLTQEAIVGRRVSHPHLMPVLAGHLGQAPYYLTLPLVAGDTLRNLLAGGRDTDWRTGSVSPLISREAPGASQPPFTHRYHYLTGRPLEIPRALWIARQTAEALAALHQHGFAHGDVKPSNILVARTGHVTLFDFGFARRIPEPPQSCVSQPFAATPAYAAPELFLENTAAARDPRSDCYSLGATLFEMLTGRIPFPDTNPIDLAAAHLHRRPPEPREFAPHLPPRVTRLLKRLLAKDPFRRPTADELVATLVELEIETFDERKAV